MTISVNLTLNRYLPFNATWSMTVLPVARARAARSKRMSSV